MKRSAVAVMDTGVNLATNGMSSRAKNRFSATRSDAQTKRQKGTLQTNVPKKFCRHRKDAPLVVTRPFKEDYPEFQEKQWRKRLREAKWGGETDVPARAKADNAHSEELTTAGGHCARVSARNHGDSNDSDLKREKKKKIVSERGPACFKGAGAQIKALVGKEPLKATAPETAADVGSEEFDAQLNEELAAERKRREKQPKKSQKTTSQSNEVSESKDHVSKGFATALETILSRELTTSNGADKSPILSEAPEIYEELSQRKQFGKAERQRRAVGNFR